MARRNQKNEPRHESGGPVEVPTPGEVVVTCEKFPQLLVTSPCVQFVDGVATVSANVAEVLLGLPTEFAITRATDALVDRTLVEDSDETEE